MNDLFIGLMSGTSMDGIDAVIVEFVDAGVKLVAEHCEIISSALREALHGLCQPGDDEINRAGVLDVQLGRLFATAVLNLLHKAKLSPQQIRAIGSHGQTVRHSPRSDYPFTLQIGDPNTIAELTGITTVADFRRRDMAKGGQGAPLVPIFHAYLFRSHKMNRAVINIGGIANVTFLPDDMDKKISGFDIGPGNTLMDAWCRHNCNKNYDKNGQWAASGKVQKKLLQHLVEDAYFKQKPPKSTGRELFNLHWLRENIAKCKVIISAEDVQATLAELTAVSIIDAIKKQQLENLELIFCGGGIYNTYLMSRIKAHGKTFSVRTSDDFSIPPANLEAMAFAYLAKLTLSGVVGNVPEVTGASGPAVLGGIWVSEAGV